MELSKQVSTAKDELKQSFENVPDVVIEEMSPLFASTDELSFDDLKRLHAKVRRYEAEIRSGHSEAIDGLKKDAVYRDMQAIRRQLELNDFSGLDLLSPVPVREDYNQGNLVCSIGLGAIGFITGSILGWVGFVNGVLALIGWGLGSSLGKSIDEQKYLTELEGYKRAFLSRVERQESEYSKVQQRANLLAEEHGRFLETCRNMIVHHINHLANEVRDVLDLFEKHLKPATRIWANTDNAKAGGKPHIKWSLDDESWLSTSKDQVFFRIYRGTGSIQTDIDHLLLNTTIELIYNKPASIDGIFVDRAASPNRTYTYYFVTHCSLEAPHVYEASDEIEVVTVNNTNIVDTETITVPVWRSTEEILEHKTSVDQARLKRKKFESKYGAALGRDDQQDPIAIIKQEMAGIKKRAEKIKHVQAAVDNARRELEELEVPEEEIDEIIEELLMRLEQ